MKKLIIFIFIFISLFILNCGSTLFIDDDTNVKDPEIRKILNSNLSLEEKWKKVSLWMKDNIEYKLDIDVHHITNYTQSPYETYILRSGDCEDISLLFAYWWLKYCDIDVNIVLSYGKTYGHVHIEYQGLNFYKIEDFDYFYQIIRKASYFLYKY